MAELGPCVDIQLEEDDLSERWNNLEGVVRSELLVMQSWIQKQLEEQTSEIQRIILTHPRVSQEPEQQPRLRRLDSNLTYIHTLDSDAGGRGGSSRMDSRLDSNLTYIATMGSDGAFGAGSSELEDPVSPSSRPVAEVSKSDNLPARLKSFLFKDATPHQELHRSSDGTMTKVKSSTMKRDWDAMMETKLKNLGEHATKRVTVEPPENLLWQLAQGQAFGLVVAFTIALNAIILGFDVEHGMWRALHSPDESRPRFYSDANTTFAAFFLLELLLRIGGERLSFIFGPMWRWNLFDSVLVLMSIIDMAAGSGGIDPSRSSSTGYIRIVKNVRMVRVLRVVRLFRFFRELRRMCMSILSSLASLAWALLFLLLIIYIFAVFFMQAGVDELNGYEGGNHIYRDEWQVWYGSMAESVFTLTKAISGGDDWGQMTTPLLHVSWIYVVAFVFYVLFVVFGVLNLLTGVFLGSAAEVLLQDRDWVTEAETIKAENFVRNVHALFSELDISRHGSVRWEEFCRALMEKETQAFFTANGLDLADAHLIFSLIANGESEIHVDDFVKGCSKLTGTAKSVQLANVQQDVDRISRELKKLRRVIAELPAKAIVDHPV